MHPIVFLVFLPLVYSLRYLAQNAGLVSIPKDIPTITRSLDLSYNNIHNISAEDFRYLPELEELHLRGNNLTGLPELDRVGDTLKFLALDSNNIKVIDPTKLGQLVKLEKLSLIDNKLTSFPNLTAVGRTLKILHIYSNDIRTINPDFVSGLVSLEELGLSGNKNLKVFPSSILKHLKVLSLDDCDVEHVPAIWTSDPGALTVSVRGRGSLKLCSCLNLWLKQVEMGGAKIRVDNDVVCGDKRWFSHSTASLLAVCEN